jgi:hypothetical protein
MLVLLDRAVRTLDRIDGELAARGTHLPAADELPGPGRVVRGALIVALSAWLPYFSSALVGWRGAFGSA